MAKALGIDYGTSTTLAAIADRGSRTWVCSPAGEEILPSVIAFPPSGKVVVGAGARARRLIDPQNAIYSAKRILGRTWSSPEAQAFTRAYPFQMERGSDDLPRFVTRAGKLSPLEVVGYQLAHLRESAHVVGQTFSSVTLTAPTSSTPEFRAALTEAAACAGFTVTNILPEPLAAALGCLVDDFSEQIAVVYDFGGGTFDVAIVRWGLGGAKLLAIGGDPFLGGDDIDLECARGIALEVLTEHHWDIRSNRVSMEKLVYLCEQAKITLSTTTETFINLGSVDAALAGKSFRVTRERLDAICLALVRRTFVICDELLFAAHLSARDVTTVILSGGGGFIPAVRAAVERYFGTPARVGVGANRLVALGAIVDAQSRLEPGRLTPVSKLHDVSGGGFMPLSGQTSVAC